MKENIYIVYDEKTLTIIKTFDWYGQAEDFAKTNNLKVINRTHPKNKNLLDQLKDFSNIQYNQEYNDYV